MQWPFSMYIDIIYIFIIYALLTYYNRLCHILTYLLRHITILVLGSGAFPKYSLYYYAFLSSKNWLEIGHCYKYEVQNWAGVSFFMMSDNKALDPVKFDSKPLNGLRGILSIHLVLFHSILFSQAKINTYGQVCTTQLLST